MKEKAEKELFSDIFFGLRKNLLFVSYILSAVALGVLVVLLLGYIPNIGAKIQMLFGMTMTIIGIVGGAFLSVLLDLPKIAHDFDEIKNDIAARKIVDPEAFGIRLTSLLCDFFKFSFFTIRYAFVKIVDTNYVYSDNVILSSIERSEFVSILDKSKHTENILYMNPHYVDGKRYHLYIIPIWFSDEWLGYIGILTPTKLLRLFRLFLADFENYYVDDQLIHVLDIKKQLIQKQFYRDIDVFSNKITKQIYSNVQEYQKDLLSFLVNQIDCAGGLFATIYTDDCVLFFRNKAIDTSVILNYYRKYSPAMTARIISDPNIPFKYVFEIPILVDKLQGVIYLFDDSDQHFWYFYKTCVEIENIKLDNDLENIALIMKLSPSKTPFLS